MTRANALEGAFDIAWSFLKKSGELRGAGESANIIMDSIERHLRAGEFRTLMLANRAISTYRERVASPSSAFETEHHMDKLTKRARPDRGKINMDRDQEVKSWSRELRNTPAQLQQIVNKVGNSAALVRKELTR